MKYHKNMVKDYTKGIVSDAENRLSRIQSEIISLEQLANELKTEEKEIVEFLGAMK